MPGYTVKISIDVIDEICNDPSDFPRNVLMQALNDANVHYKYGNKSKNWYDSVCSILKSYL